MSRTNKNPNIYRSKWDMPHNSLKDYKRKKRKKEEYLEELEEETMEDDEEYLSVEEL